MVILSDIPAIPSDHTIAEFEAAFFSSFEQHVFLKSVIARSLATQGGPPPYLELALACLGAATGTLEGSPYDTVAPLEPSQSQVAADLFVAGMNLWSVMMEVDNRESRLCAAVTGVRAPGREVHFTTFEETNSDLLRRQHYFPLMVCYR